MKEKRTVFFIMVHHPLKGWMRCGNAYGSREMAREWLPIVKGAWHGLKTKISPFTFNLENGKPDEKARDILNNKYNLDL